MHLDPEGFAKVIRQLAENAGIQSEVGKVLFGLECLLALILLAVVSIFALHDIIMVLLKQHGGEAIEALQWCLVVFVISMFFVLLREHLRGRGDK